MSRDCMYRNNHLCDIWMDYRINQVALDEASELCHGNWIEIQHLRERIDLLERILQECGIDVPPEY